MVVAVSLIVLGFFLLIKGAGWMVDGASALAKKNNVSDLAIGLTIVAFGTSAPEMVVNTIASFQQQPDIVFGNVIGSNNFNLFMILGIVGLISPFVVQSSTVWKEIPISFLAVIVLYALCNNFFIQENPMLSRIDGLVLIALFGLFILYVYKQMRQDPIEPDLSVQYLSNLKIWVLIVIGLAALVVGGKLVVDDASKLAAMLGVSEKIIGLTIVAAGTSLPELVTSVVAAVKKNSDIAIGNIIGSNIFNIFLILSISSFVRPITFNPVFNTDIYLLGAGTLLLFIAMFSGKKKKLDRWEAGILLGIFVVYTTLLIVKEI
jgi:cation:H+ antiporter